MGTQKITLNRNKKSSHSFEIGDKVVCIDYEGLGQDIIDWLEAREAHPVRYVFSANTEPILILEPIEGRESPKLDKKDYPFLGERFIKRK